MAVETDGSSDEDRRRRRTEEKPAAQVRFLMVQEKEEQAEIPVWTKPPTAEKEVAPPGGRRGSPLLARTKLAGGDRVGLQRNKKKKPKNGHKARLKHQFRTTKTTLQQVLNNHEHVFKEEFGTLEGMEATIHVNIKSNKNMLSGQAQQPGKHHANVLSRPSLPDTASEKEMTEQVWMMDVLVDADTHGQVKDGVERA